MSLLRLGLALLIAFAVLAHGAVEVWSVALVEIGAALLLLAWVAVVLWRADATLSWNPLLVPTGLLAAWALLQWLIPFSVYPYQTKLALMVLTAGFVVQFLGVQAFRNAGEARGLVWFLLAFGFGVALFGILHHFTDNGRLYWIREPHYSSYSFGPYVNRNHFAGLMELILPLGLALLAGRAVRRDKVWLVAVLTVIPVGALFLSASRGGIAALLVQCLLLIYLLRGRGQRPVGLGVAALFLAVAIAFVGWLGAGAFLDRFSTLPEDELGHGFRLRMIEDSLRVARAHPWTGTGLGTLVTVYPQFQSVYSAKVVDHAHNDLAELLAETGLPGGVLAFAFLALLGRNGLARVRADALPFALSLRTGCLVACAGYLVHSLVDFPFHIPANSILFGLLAGLATLPAEPVVARSEPRWPALRDPLTR
jgi:O-antigen ligase